MKAVKVLSFFIVLSVSAFGQTSKSELTGFWDNGGSWVGGTFPGSATSTVITATTKVITVDGMIKSNKTVSLNASSLTVNAGDTVVILGDLNLLAVSSVTNNGVLVVLGNVTNTASAVSNTASGKMVVTGNYTNALGSNTFTTPPYLYNAPTGFLSAPSYSTKANLISNDIALYNWVNMINGALPITLSSFEAYTNNSIVNLTWTTACEINNDFFTLERSTNGENFEKIANVNGKGNSNESISYQFTDTHPAVGQNYYRLSQTDFDGHEEYFNVVYVNVLEKINASIFPNPTAEYIYVINTTDEFDYAIKDVKGLSIATGNANGSTKINVESLRPGVYYLEFSTGTNKTGTFRFVKN